MANPSALFLSQHARAVPGSAIVATLEGHAPAAGRDPGAGRPVHAPKPRRLSVGLEQNRLAMLLAVLHRHAGVGPADHDVFVNAVGGVRINEPAADLAILLAVHSSLAAAVAGQAAGVRRSRARRRDTARAARPGAPARSGEARLRADVNSKHE